MKSKILKFPKNFLWGSATAAHQVEGNNKNSDWWEFEKKKGNIENNEVSGIAVDHYNRYEQDFDIARSLNHNIHRFSIEWARIEPEEGKFDKSKIEHYRKVIQALKERKMKVVLTLFHFTLPNWFAKKGGWENIKAVEFFLRYVEYVVKELGNEVDFWVTINEPLVYSSQSYLLGNFPPKVKSIFRFFKVVNTLITVHKESYLLIHKYFDNAKVCFSKNIPFFEPYRKEIFLDRVSAKLADYIVNDYFISKTSQYIDFFGLQYYVHSRVKFKLGGSYFNLGEEVGIETSENAIVTEMGWEIYPDGIYHALKKLQKYKLPIIITENGIADKRDEHRADFVRDHLINVHKAIQEGVDVRGYLYWSLMDNFEWIFGRRPRFGLVEIDYEKDLERRVRKSALYFSKICKNNAVDLK